MSQIEIQMRLEIQMHKWFGIQMKVESEIHANKYSSAIQTLMQIEIQMSK